MFSERYEEAVKAFEYWSFPFCEFPKNMSKVNKNDAMNTNLTKLNLIERSQILRQLLDTVQKDEIELLTDKDNFIQNFQDLDFTKWSMERNPIEMRRLFSGELATFDAKVDDSQYDAVKFKTVYVTFNTTIKEQEKLNRLLEKCFIELTHSGMSNYKFRGKIFSIAQSYKSGENLMLRYKYNSHMSNADGNESIKKLSRTRPILSPYSLWTIRISPQSQENRSQILSEFKEFLLQNGKQNMTISLRGSGSYVLNSFVNSIESCRNIDSNEKNY